MAPTLIKKHISLIFAVCFFGCLAAKAQLAANFTVDKTGGCSPLTVQFTNTTTGASSNATYKWDLGNGNTSGLANPGATYVQAQTYTVKLTVTDGAATSTKTATVTVFKNPTVSFSVTPVSGCLPLNVNFTSNATAGDGTISNYFWDFGDGQTQSGSGYAQTSHTYTFAQSAGINLTVTNSNGCYSSYSKQGAVTVSQAVNASFSADQTNLCQPNSQVVFTNNSTGAGTITYKWDFGDGQTSTSTSPAHTYTTKGTYTVTLTAASSLGCSSDTVKTDYINVANFSVDFTTPTPVCTGGEMDMTDISTANFTSTAWFTDGQPTYSYSNYYNVYAFYFNDTASHNIKLTHTYGNCTVSKTKTVKASAAPVPLGFTAVVKGGACTPPITVNFSDTSKDGAVAWAWSADYFNSTFASGQSSSYAFGYQQNYTVSLKVTNAAGCSATIAQPVNLAPPNIYIVLKESNGLNYYSACTGAITHLAAADADVIKSYQWNFGDGSAPDTAARPLHKFAKAGNFTITLNYVTLTGCTGTVTYGPVTILDNVNFTFTALPDSVVCGNSFVTFTLSPQLPDWFSSWNFGDYSTGSNYSTSISHQYYYDSVYTVSVIVSNQGCADTIVKPNYITVKPDFPKIAWQTNTCDGTRGKVTFVQSSRKVNKWIWNFGDGSAAVTYNSEVDTVFHTYTKSGTYNVVLTGINGACSVGDSVTSYVLLKQSPQLSSPQSSACGSDNVSITLNNYEANPAPYYSGYYYYFNTVQYGDLTPAPFPVYGFNYDATSFNGTLTGLNPGESKLRIITQEAWFNCLDTSNFIPLKIHGPLAGFEFITNNVCFKSPVVLKDTSVAGVNVPIKTWAWGMGDGTTLTKNNSNNISYTYANPGQYWVSLTVTDTAGCTNTSANNYSNYAQVSGPKAGFTSSQNTVPPNTTVYFYNNSNAYNAYDVTYTWLLPDGTQPQGYSTSFLFTTAGTDTVRLISSNNQLTCVDTALQVIYVRTVNTAFTYTYSYINNNNCPPVIVTFTSTTSNASSISWNFGDGSQGGNQAVVSHTYNAAGVYRVVLYGLDANNNIDSTVDFVTVKGPYAVMAADKLAGCDSLTVELSASIKNASSFTWDFGDGTLQTSTDTFSVHQYVIPGVYTPELILKDAGGCASTSALPAKIVVDMLSASVTNTPVVICDSSTVYFTPAVTSLAVSQLQQPLQYHWYFGTGNAADTAGQASSLFYYTKTGPYAAAVTVTSPYGCVQTATDNITVQPVSRAGISGPASICVNTATAFTGTATNFMAGLGWSWQFGDGNSNAAGQGPVNVSYKDSGAYTVTLIVNNNGCYDTARAALQVHGAPLVNILPLQPFVCLGSQVQLIAHNAQTYAWQPGTDISDVNSSSPFVSPKTSQWYSVQATNIFGCFSNDSVWVKVDFPFKLKTDPALNICLGSKGQFNVTGASTYKWISGSGLSNTQIPNPVVTTSTTQQYTVVGYDADGCFTDTAVIQLNIEPNPTVIVSPHAVTVNAGSNVQLATQASADVLSYAWLPADYLSCTACAAPVSTPAQPEVYIVTVTNSYGCIGADTAKINLLCSQDLIYIPNAFTPNNDNINDRFVIKGSGIRLVKHIAIFGRHGEKVFERSNIASDDYNNSWDGTLNGLPVPPGVYVYMTDIMCATGVAYSYKGTITVIR